MPKPFLLGQKGSRSQDALTHRFSTLGLRANPFPQVGIETGVFFEGHLSEQLIQINAWLGRVQSASQEPGHPIPPIAVRGSLGVGKTHLLATIERGLESRDYLVQRHMLTDTGSSRLMLANLLLSGRAPADTGQTSPSSLVARIVARIADIEGQAALEQALKALPVDSPVRIAFQAILRASKADREAMASWFGHWLGRAHTTPVQRNRLGLAGTLEGEGAAIQAIAHLAEVAARVRELTLWFVLIDQLEELWRPGVVTPVRRARFLTDLRQLIDLAYEGAPFAVLMAWNTGTDVDLPRTSRGEEPVTERLRQDYQALWDRLGAPVELPKLEREHLWPFAEEYLNHALELSEASSQDQNVVAQRERFRLLLQTQGVRKVEDRLRNERKNDPNPLYPRYSAREALSAWRVVAEELVLSP